MGRENEKVVGTRLSEADQEALELLAVFHDQTVGALLRTAVREFIEKEQSHIHPLSLEAAVSLGGAIGRETSLITANATSLTNASYGNAGGVYLLVHPETRELYVGSSTELSNRLTHHRFCIKAGSHKNAAINGWVLDEVVVVILEGCEVVKNAAGKRSLLAREQYWIDILKLSKEWTLLNITGALSESNKAAVLPTTLTANTSVKVQAVKGAGTERHGGQQQTSTPPDAFETFYSTVIEQGLLPVLQEESSSRDVVSLFEGCKDEKEKRWFLEFLHSYNSQWLNSLADSGKFPWVSKLMAAQVQ